MRPITAAQASRCENATGRRCGCRCHGVAHGARRGDVRDLPDADPHALDRLEDDDAPAQLEPVTPQPAAEWIQLPLPGFEAPATAARTADTARRWLTRSRPGVTRSERPLGASQRIYAQSGGRNR